ncbi:MAG: hypothetical protein WAW87_01820 [Candidatus Ferrigenium altingense]
MDKYIFEIVKEYVLKHDNLDFSVKGRVTKTVRDDVDEHYWEISHHYRPTVSSGGRYYPSHVKTKTFEDAENLLLMYMEGFTDIDVALNKSY